MTPCISSDQSPSTPITTRNQLLTLFKETRRKDSDHVLSTEHLVELLGGIDKVMDIVLSSMDHRMTHDNIAAMKDHLERSLPSSTVVPMKQHLEGRAPSSTHKVLKWTLNPHNNMLYEISSFIHRHHFSQIIIGGVVGASVLWRLLSVIFIDCAECLMYVSLASSVYHCLFAIPFVIALLLRVNKSMIPRILRTADFWITTGSAVILFIYASLKLFYNNSDHISLNVTIFYFCSQCIATMSFFISVCCFDGIYGLKPMIRILITTAMAITCGFQSFLFGFVYEEKVIRIPNLGEYGRVSITGGMANYFQILCLFLAKMALNSWRKRGRCILVKYYPFIEWIDVSIEIEINAEKTMVEIQRQKEGEVLALFKEIRCNNPDLVLSTEYLVELLGGVDTVMDIVLNSVDHEMTHDNIMAMKDHLEGRAPSNLSTRKILKWTLNPHNNMLYEISPFIHRHLFSKIIIGVVLSVCVLFLMLYVLFAECAECLMYVYLASTVYYCLFATPFLIAVLLRINKWMIPRIVMTADFWITIGSAVILYIYHGFELFYDNSDHISLTVDILYFCSQCIAFMLFFIAVCSLDGIDGLRPTSRILITTIVAFGCGILSFFFGFVHEEKVIRIPNLGEYGRVSITGGWSNYMQILCLFLAKMAFNSWHRRGRCILVKHSPFIEWTDVLVDDNCEKTMAEIQRSKEVNVGGDGDKQ